MVLFVDANAMYNPFDIQQRTFRTDGGPTRTTRTSAEPACAGRKARASSARPRNGPENREGGDGDIGPGLVICSEQWKASKVATSTYDLVAHRSFAGSDKASVSAVPPGVQATAVALGTSGHAPPRVPSGRAAQAQPRDKPPFVATVRPTRGAAQRGSGSAPARSRQSSPGPSRFEPPSRRGNAGNCVGVVASEVAETIVRTHVSSQRPAPTSQGECQHQSAPNGCVDAVPSGTMTTRAEPPAMFAAGASEMPPDLENMLRKLRGLRAAATKGPEPKPFETSVQAKSDGDSSDLIGLANSQRQEEKTRSVSPHENVSAQHSFLEPEMTLQEADGTDAATHNRNGAESVESDVTWQQVELRVFLRRAGLEDLFLPITTQLAKNLTDLLAVPDADIRRLPWKGKGGQRLLSVLKTERGRRTISLDTEAQDLARGREFLRRSQSVERGSLHKAAGNRRSLSCIAVEAKPSALEIAEVAPCTLQELTGDSSAHVTQDVPALPVHASWISSTDDSTQDESLLEAPSAIAWEAVSADSPNLRPSQPIIGAQHQAERRASSKPAVVRSKKPPASAPAVRSRSQSRGGQKAPKQPTRSLVPRCAPSAVVPQTDGAPRSREAPATTAPRADSKSTLPPQAPELEVSCGATCEARCEAGHKSSRKAPGANNRPSARSRTRKARIHELLRALHPCPLEASSSWIRALEPCPFEAARVADRQGQARDRHVQRRAPSPGVGLDASSSSRRSGRSLMDLVATSAKEEAAVASPLLSDLVASLPTAPAAEGCTEICAICLEVPTCGEEVTSLPCFHTYHKECIHEWLVHSRLCPLCKGPADFQCREC